MKATLLLITILFTSSISFSQNPLVKEWDYRFGGTEDERLTCLQQTSDGGCVLGGYSYSGISGDKTQALWGQWGLADYWIVKIDSLGNMQWDKDFGGNKSDYLYTLQQTADGGYILGGRSDSGTNGNKTQPTWGFSDYWIVKIDSFGNIQWDKDFGGTGEDWLFSLQQTTDGGYILGGYSGSGISGNKTQATWGYVDYWIVKIDSLGNLQWDKDFGGTGNDVLSSLQQTTDEGYILGGYSDSGISGNKTEPTWGYNDYWIVKIDSLGNFQWDKDLGGTNGDRLSSLQQTTDGGYILGGISYSGQSGNKTQALWGVYGYPDYWVVKIDLNGKIQWDKDFGGTLTEDDFGNITQTSDGGYLMAGTSYSPISGDKSEANLFWDEQTWVLKADAFGNKQWDKTIFTVGHDEQGFALQTMNGCYVIANNTPGGIGGYKTQPSWGYGDYWIIKFCDTTQTGILDILTSDKISIYPNPFTTTATITINSEGRFDFILYDVFGREVFKSQIVNSKSQIERGNLPAGVYFYKVKEEACPPDRRGKMIGSGKVVVQ